MHPSFRLSAAAGLVALLSACSSTKPPAPAAPAQAAAPAPMPVPAPPAATTRPAPAPGVQGSALAAHLDPSSDIAAQRVVYFDFDEYVVKNEFSPLLERQGRYLAANPTLRIRIEGSTDARGSAEYNLALGQRRAEAVRQALKVVGVGDNQMEATSWGAERPAVQGSDESAWSRNRRAELMYPRP